jgi:hypothetical protein
MHLDGKISFEYVSGQVAEAVARLIQTDNEIAPKTLKIRTSAEKTMAVTRIQTERTSTFFSTIDDLIFSEKLISEIIGICGT